MSARTNQVQSIANRWACGALSTMALSALLALALLAGCGDQSAPSKRGCVIVDASPGPLLELTGAYIPGFERFVTRIAQHGTGQVCFAFAGQGLSGGPDAVAHFSCQDPADDLRCPPQIRQSVLAAAAQLQRTAAGARSLLGASQLLEAIALVAPATRAGDEILMLSDAVQNSSTTGDFATRSVQLGSQGDRRLLDLLATRGLLPDLHGRRLLVPYALYRSNGPMHMSAPRKIQVQAFWEAYAQRTGAELVFGGGSDAA